MWFKHSYVARVMNMRTKSDPLEGSWQAKGIAFADGIITMTPESSESRGYLIGRAGKNLRNMESIIQRYFPIKEVRVV